RILAEWKEELKEIDPAALPPEMQSKAELFKKILDVKPFDVRGVPELYASQFRHLPTTRPENHGYLTFVYPAVDLFEGKNMLQFTDQTYELKTKGGKIYHSAGLPILYAKLARIVLQDGWITVILAGIWILVMHFADFRNTKLALASVIPLCVGLLMMLGIMAIVNAQLNFMNIVILPILLGFGVSHGLYLLHRFLEGVSPVVAFRSVGAAVASSTLTTIAAFAALFAASHNGLKSMGLVACLGLATTLLVSFTVLASVLQIMHDNRSKRANKGDDKEERSAA
ncbi:MAG TPA: MMPL family transporter, partial [Myxococcaceae bacterium]|nr:MMPL family transporter [Myxococcaceae bacterium]